MKMFGWLRGLSIAALLVLPALAFADPIGPNCGTCDGGIYTLSWSGSPLSTTATTETDEITLTIDTSGVTASLIGQGGTAPFFLNSVAPKIVGNKADLISATLVSAPSPLSMWTHVPGGLNSGGCDGSLDGFDCWTAAPATGAALGGILTFVFDETITLGKLTTAADIKALYVDSNNNHVGNLLSEAITLQTTTSSSTSSTSSTGISSTGNAPEPSSSSLALLAVGLLAAGLGARRKA